MGWDAWGLREGFQEDGFSGRSHSGDEEVEHDKA